MKTRILLILVTTLAMSLPIQLVYAPPSVNPDWQNYPYCPGGCPRDYLVEEWAKYYDLKGSEWMESKKQEMLSAMNNGTVRQWVENDPIKANQNVFTYYYILGEIPDYDGKYFPEIPSCGEIYLLEDEEICYLEKEPPCPEPSFRKDGLCVIEKTSICMVDEKFRNVECLDKKENQVRCGEGTKLVENQCVPVCEEDSYYENGLCIVMNPEPIVHRDCLIATASFGSELAPQVQMLREVRDNVLLSTHSGTLFMDGFNTVYYSFSPQIANLENENLIFKETVRIFITPLITALSVMTLAEENSEFQVILFGISTIGLIVGMYVVAPVAVIWKIHTRK